ncbi:MAG: protein kinase [Lachnospiraceae bacterium]|nr:protein kinase [Lachnospiraceae bacterium]
MEQSEITRLPLYRDLPHASSETGAPLVQHIETGKTYVKKELSDYDRSVFEYIRMRDIPGIPKIFDIIENFADDGLPDTLIVIEEYITGSPLRTVLDAYGPIKPDIALDYMIQICQSLLPLHDRKRPIVHCRIMPENIIVTRTGNVYLINFDAAKEIDPDSANFKAMNAGSNQNAYIASGQFEFLPPSTRTDVLECGSLFREMITGVSPASPTPKVSMLDRPEVELLEPIITKCTETDPAARYADAAELLAALKEVVPEIERLLAERMPTSRKRLLLRVLTFIIFLMAILILAWFLSGGRFM